MKHDPARIQLTNVTWEDNKQLTKGTGAYIRPTH